VAPTLPAEAKGASEAAAKAFVRHYVASVNYAMATGDTQGVARLAKSSCTTCTAVVERIHAVYQGGGRLKGAGWKILSLAHVSAGSHRTAFISVGIEISPQVAYAGESAPPSHSPRSRGNLDFVLSWTVNRWVVERLEATQ
jgi:hypothetical protein